MAVIDSRLDVRSAAFADNRAHMEALLGQLRALEARTREASAAVGPRFARQGKLLPRDRVALLLDPGMPHIELSSLAGYGQDEDDAGRRRGHDSTVPGGGAIAVIGYVAGVRSMVVADDAGIDAGALQPKGIEKFQRAQDIALQNKLPFVHLIESAGANLLKYQVEQFILGGKGFYNLARLSAAGLPVIGVVHGSSTAGGAYMTGLSDVVIMVRGRAKAFLAGPPLLKAATGEIATDEELGGAQMHNLVSGTSEYLAEDDADALRTARDVLARLPWARGSLPLPIGPAPRYAQEELLGVMPADPKKPVDMREVIARAVDGSDFLEFKAQFGAQTVCGHASLCGMPIGIVTNNGPLDPDGANKATHFIQHCCQTGVPIVYLQNTTGYIVGTQSERAGMIKIGSRMIQAVSNATVPQVTLMCGASFGAGNYGMCGRSFAPRFVFSWPNARTAVMGAEQAAGTMAIVMEEGARRRGTPLPDTALAQMRARVVETFERQQSAFYTSGLLLDDGVIDPRDTRRVLAFALSVCAEAQQRVVRPLDFGVARM
jgi:geranyl-CoA carboxylase beta subunit